ncbi:MAG: hypothetical protein K2G36_01705 [Ruminococcus sp.]|nr:hypothetical protein [Ruminococcus sp.]
MNTFLFVTAFIITVSTSLVFLHEITENNKSPSPLTLNIRSIARGISIFMFIVGISDKSGLIDFGIYSGTYFIMGLVCPVTCILCEINKKHKISSITFAIKIIITALILELTVFNISAYRTWFGDYPQITYEASRALLDKGGIYRRNDNSIGVRNGEELIIKIPDVNRQVSTVYLDMYLDNGTRSAEFSIDATDETQSYVPRQNIAKTIISRSQPQTHYLQCELSGEVGELTIRLKPVNSGSAHVKSITLNQSVPIEISWVRFLLIVLLGIFIHAVIKGTFLNRSFKENRKFCRIAVVCITAFACVWAVWVTHYRFDGRTWKEELSRTSGSQLSQQLVEAFEDGRTYLFPQPDENLINFDNPYDNQHRESKLVPLWDNDYAKNSAWDHVYFDGKFYSYYGIAPVILLFLPYNVLTGYYFPESIAVLIFAIIGIIGLSMFFTKFTGKFFPDLPTSMYIAGLIIMQMTSGIWYSVGRPLFYEVAMAAGFAFMTWSFYFLISSNIIGEGKISLIKTAVSSLLIAVAVLCRPTIVLYCICVFVFMLLAVSKFADGKRKNKKKQKLINRQSRNYILCALLPMACLGLIQMIYNYVRFRSPFEFGIQYSLTINDFRNTQFHWRLSLIPLWNYLFNVPVLSTEYPFISAEFQDMNVGGFFYNDFTSTHNVCGLFFLALPMFAYIFSGKAIRTISDGKNVLRNLMYVIIPCVAIPLIIICSVWESGYSIRYMTDFAWQMLTGAYVIIFCIYAKSQNPTIRRLINIIFCVSMVWTIIASGVQSFNQVFRYCESHLDYPEMAYELEKIFMFWK